MTGTAPTEGRGSDAAAGSGYRGSRRDRYPEHAFFRTIKAAPSTGDKPRRKESQAVRELLAL